MYVNENMQMLKVKAMLKCFDESETEYLAKESPYYLNNREEH